MSAMPLSPEQQRAVTRTGQDVCVVAGPGSGKTRVLSERFRWLVEEQGVSPLRILAITFTEKAAAEIKERLVGALDQRWREPFEQAYVSTIHGFCARLLRENALAAGVDPEFNVLDEPSALAESNAAATAVLDRLCALHPAIWRRILRALDLTADGDANLPASFLDALEASRIAGIDLNCLHPPALSNQAWTDLCDACRRISTAPQVRCNTDKQRDAHPRIRDWARDLLAGPTDRLRVLSEFDFHLGHLVSGSIARTEAKRIKEELLRAARRDIIVAEHADLYQHLIDALRNIAADYRARKRRRAALDFGDLEECAIALLENNPDVRERIRAGFDHVLMDELQDTNPLQWRLVDLIRRPNAFFAVGDINQSIYGFRHADPDVFRNYRDELRESGGVIDELRDNYRSRPEILATINCTLPALAGIEPHKLVEKRDPGGAIEWLATFHDDRDEAARTEALWIARRIRELVASNLVSLRQIAVLSRTTSALTEIQQACDAFDIPTVVIGGRSFHEAREIRDLTSLLAVLANPRDEVRLAGVLRSPLVGLSDEDIFRLKQSGHLADAINTLGSTEPRPSGSGLANPSAAAHSTEPRPSGSGHDEQLTSFIHLLNQQRARRDAVSPDRLLLPFIDSVNYSAALSPRARANIQKFLATLRDRHAAEPKLLASVVADLAVVREAETDPEAAPIGSADVVSLMTIHQAKGLEFPTVFVAQINAGKPNKMPAFLIDNNAGFGVRWRDPLSLAGVPDAIHDAESKRIKQREEAEEDRLYYVAFTRAEERLIFTSSFTPKNHPTRPKNLAAALDLQSAQQEQEQTTITLNKASVPTSVRVTSQEPANDFPPLLLTSGAGELALPPPAIDDQHDSVVTVTAVSQHEHCPRQYYLARYLGWQQDQDHLTTEPRPSGSGPSGSGPSGSGPSGSGPDDDHIDAAELGTVVHRLLAGSNDEAPEEARKLADAFKKSPLASRAAGAKRIEREHDFLFALDDTVLRGQIDLWFEDENGELIVVDYKTNRQQPDDLRAYETQLRLYALAIERATGRRPDRAFLFFLRTATPVEVSLDEASLAAARNAVTRLSEAQNALHFPLNEGGHCHQCPFHRGLCPSQYKPQG